MTEYRIVAVSHELRLDENSDRLMSQNSLVMFTDLVAPLITNNSLILREAFDYHKFVGPGDSRYNFLRTDFGDSLGSVCPLFGGYDFRATSHPEANNRIANRYQEWESVVKDLVIVDWQTLPRNLSEAVVMARKPGLRAYLRRPPTRAEVELARWTTATDRKFDRLYLEAMRKYGRRFDVCLFVGGAVHALAMAVKSEYCLVDAIPDTDAPFVYYAYLATYVLNRLILEAGS